MKHFVFHLIFLDPELARSILRKFWLSKCENGSWNLKWKLVHNPFYKCVSFCASVNILHLEINFNLYLVFPGLLLFYCSSSCRISKPFFSSTCRSLWDIWFHIQINEFIKQMKHLPHAWISRSWHNRCGYFVSLHVFLLHKTVDIAPNVLLIRPQLWKSIIESHVQWNFK